jgi:hypothetical protein
MALKSSGYTVIGSYYLICTLCVSIYRTPHYMRHDKVYLEGNNEQGNQH